MSELSPGDRIAQIRRRRGMTQEEVADRAGISKDVIVKLEQNRRKGARVSTMHAIARALDVETRELLGPGVEISEADNGDSAHLLELRRILAPSPFATAETDEISDAAAFRESVIGVTRAYQDSRFKRALGELPDLLTRGEAAVSSNPSDDGVYRLLSFSYIAAAQTLTQLRHEDLAYEAVRRAMVGAEKASDEVLYGACIDSLAWIFIRQARFSEAENVAAHVADSMEPKLSAAGPLQIATWGRLLVRASAAAVRNNRPTQARDFLSLARAAAARLGEDRMAFDSYWTSFGPNRVATLEVQNAVVSGDPDRALYLARPIRQIPRGRSDQWLRHLLTVAEAQVATRRYGEATKILVSTGKTAPEWTGNQRLARHLVRDLLDALPVRVSKSTGLAELAGQMGLAP